MGIEKIIYLPRALADSAKVLSNHQLPPALRSQLWWASLKLKWQLNFCPHKDQVSVSLGGHPFLLPNHASSQWLLKEIFWDEVYLPLVPLASPIRLLDLGANAGLASFYFRQKYGLQKLVCAEPDPANFNRLSSNLRHWEPGVRLLQVAVSAGSGTLYLHQDRQNPLQVSTGSAPSDLRVDAKGIVELLDGGFDLVKMDIEGAEWPIIKQLCSMNGWALAGYWLMEWHGEQEQQRIVEMLMHFCSRQGYRLEKRKGVWHLQTSRS